MTGLKLWLFGPPRFERDGVAIDISRRKAIALLVYLALTQQSHSRDALATLFWPEFDQSHARGTLRRVLSDLHKGLGESWLETEGEIVALRTGPDLWLDVLAFRALLAEYHRHGHPGDEVCEGCQPLLAKAVCLYRDDFLAGFTLPDSPAFDEWQFFQTESLRRDLAKTLEQLVRYHHAREEFEPAIVYARRWLNLDPLLEIPHRTLMELYAWNGQRSAALRQYQECVRLLEEELGVQPVAETTLLYERIRRDELTTPLGRGRQAQQNEDMRTREMGVDSLLPRPAAAEDELRLVTVLSAGLSGLTDQTWDSRPEDMAEAAHNLRRIAAEMAIRYEARLDHTGGEGLQLLFGLPRLHEDDPGRAVQVGLDLQQVAQRHKLKVSIGISTGQVYFNPMDAAGSPTTVAVGSVVNLAARLQNSAEAGQILVSQATYRHTRRAFDFKPVTIAFGSKNELLTAYVVRAALPHPDKTRGIEGLQAELIGRDEELDQLKTALEAVYQGQGRIVTLMGEAGLGKSRLVAELKQAVLNSRPGIPQPLWLEGRCLEFRKATSYWPFVDLLQNYLNTRAKAYPYQNDCCLVPILTELANQNYLPAARAAEMAPLLGNLLSLRENRAWTEQLENASPGQIRHQTFTAVYDFILALARQQPLILVFEDVHWADDLSLDLFTLLLDMAPVSPVLLLYIYRLDQQPKVQRLARLAAQKYQAFYTELHLQELTEPMSRRLVQALLGLETLPEMVKTLILEKARGNPFFVEEAIRALIDDGAICQVDGQWQVGCEVEAISVPESVQSVILSRVDRLESNLKQVLYHAAVMGRLFRPQVIAWTLPPEIELEQALLALEEIALIYQERVVPEVEYSFKHALVQETIYQTLSRQRRSRLHQLVAEAIEQYYADHLKAYYEQLAYHYYHSQATEKAIKYLLKAGEKSGAAYFNEEAIHYLQKALQRVDEWPAGNSDREAQRVEWQLAILTSLGEIYHGMGRHAEAEPYLRRAVTLGQAANIPAKKLVRLYYWLTEVLHWLDRHVEQVNVAKAGLALLDEQDMESVEAVLMNQAMAIGYTYLGRFDLFDTLTQRTAQFIQCLPYSKELRPAYLHIIVAFHQAQQLDQAIEWARRLEALAEKHHDLRALGEAIEHSWGPCFESGQLHDPEQRFLRSLELYTRIGDKSRQWRCQESIAWNALLRGDLDEAQKYSIQQLEVAQELGREAEITGSWLNLGVVRLNLHAWEQAVEALSQALQLTSRAEPGWVRWTAPYCLGRLYLARGQHSTALPHFQTALNLFECEVWSQWGPHWWPLLAGILSGLEAAYDTPAEFQSFCQSLPEAKRRQIAATLPGPWWLEPTTPANLSLPSFEDTFVEGLASGWTWHDPFGDCTFRAQNGLEIQAANGRDLWYYVNRSAPRLLRPISGDFAVQTVCTPVWAGRDPHQAKNDPKPAIGGLLLWQDTNNLLRLVWGSRGPYDLSFEGCQASQEVLIGRGRLPIQAPSDQMRVFLRLERQGSQVKALAGIDGRVWYSVGQATLPVTDPVEAGIHAVGWIDRTIYPGAYPDGTAIRFESCHFFVY